MADWLARVARAQKATVELTVMCVGVPPGELPLEHLEPLRSTAEQQLVGANLGVSGGQIAKKGRQKKPATKAKLRDRNSPRCDVCTMQGGDPRLCGECGRYYHAFCLGLVNWDPGPFYCDNCRTRLRE